MFADNLWTCKHLSRCCCFCLCSTLCIGLFLVPTELECQSKWNHLSAVVLLCVMAMRDSSPVFMSCAGDESCGCSPISQAGFCLYSQRKLQLPGDACTSAQGEGTLLHSEMTLCDKALGSFLTFHVLYLFNWLEGSGGCQQQPQEEYVPRGQCWISAEVRGN